MDRSRTINRLFLGVLGACLAGGVAWVTPAPWNWIPFVAVGCLVLRDLIIERTSLKQYRTAGGERRLVLGLAAVMVLASISVRRINDALRAPATWADLLRNSAGCGVNRRCFLEVEGHEALTGQPKSGKFMISGFRDGGIILDGVEEHWWAHPDEQRTDHFRHFVPGNFQLLLGDKVLTRPIEPPIEGLTVTEIGSGLLTAAGNAPDPFTLPSRLNWQTMDIRVSGECVLKQSLPPGFKLHSGRLWSQGKRIVFDSACPLDLTNSGVTVPVERGSIRVTWPQAIPAPDLKANQFMDHMLG